MYLLFLFQAIEKIQWHSEMPQEIYRLLLGLYLPVMILGTTLNALLLFTMLSTKKLRTDPRNSFILALAFSDFFLCNFTSPLTLWSTLEGHWPFGGMGTEILCRFVKAGQDFPIIISSFCIGAIACDRFRYIVTPYRTQMTASQVSTQKRDVVSRCKNSLSSSCCTSKTLQYIDDGTKKDWLTISLDTV